jgi:hypothetical protein
MITFFEIARLNFITITKTFNKEDFQIFPLSKRPKYYLFIKRLYEIKHNQLVVGHIYILKTAVFINNEIMHEVCIFIKKDFRGMGIGKIALFEFMKENGPLFFVVSQKNLIMLKTASDNSKFCQSSVMNGHRVYFLKT